MLRVLTQEDLPVDAIEGSATEGPTTMRGKQHPVKRACNMAWQEAGTVYNRRELNRLNVRRQLRSKAETAEDRRM